MASIASGVSRGQKLAACVAGREGEASSVDCGQQITAPALHSRAAVDVAKARPPARPGLLAPRRRCRPQDRYGPSRALPDHHHLEPRKVRDLATLEFVERHANVALLGPPGVGKTHLASALAVAACRASYSV
jgi:IstB-like ATP binding protein